MLNKSLMVLAIFVAMIHKGHATISHLVDILKDEITGILYQKNDFGDFLISLKGIQKEELTDKLTSFVKNYASSNASSAFIVKLVNDELTFINDVRRAGFSHHYTTYNSSQNSEVYSEWIVRNKSLVPQPLTTIGGAMILFIEDAKVLLVEEKTRKGQWSFPGGLQDFGELPIQTAIREAKEEVGLLVEAQDLKLIAEIQRRKANRYGANENSKVYLVTKYTGQLQQQEEEIIQSLWISIKELLKDKQFKGVKITDHNAAIIRHAFNIVDQLKNKQVRSHRLQFPDLRQINKKPEEQDINDVMYVELIN